MNDIEEIIEKVKKGETEYFREIINEYQQKLFKYCFYMLQNIEEAEDAVQEVFIKVCEKLNKYNYKMSFNAWIYKITYNHCINLIRRKKYFNI